MGFIDNVLILINKQGITKNKMLKDLGMGTGTFNTWEKRGTIPSGETLSKIANYFEVSTDYLLGNEQKNKLPSDEGSLSGKKKELFKLFDKMTDEQQETLMRVARSISPEPSSKDM